MRTIIALTAGLAVASSLPLAAQSITWDLAGNAGYGLSNGQSLSFTTNGTKVTASAWSYTKGSSDNALESAKLTQWNPNGLGVVNREENNSSPWHQVDNYEENDYVLFVFDTLVDVSKVRVQASPGPYDLDASYWVGNIASSNLDNVTYSGLVSRGFGTEQVNSGSRTSDARNVSINSPATGVNAILFGAKRGIFDDDDEKYLDAFKIKSITATVIPEPSAFLLSALGALGFCLRRRR